MGSKKSGCGLDPDEGVIFGVLVGIDCIVEKGPDDSCNIEVKRWGFERATVSRPREQCSPVEREAQEHLWPPCETLGEGVNGDRDESQNTKENRSCVECQQDAKRDQRLETHPNSGLPGGHLTRGDGPRTGTLHGAVKVAVCYVVPCAARAAHEKCTRGACDEDPKVMPCHDAVMEHGKQQAPPAGNQQKPSANGPVRAGQSQVGPRAKWRIAVDPVSFDGVRNLSVLLWRILVAAHMFWPMTDVKIRLFVDHPLGAGQSLALDKAQSHYLFGVMRQQVGAKIAVFNGCDGEWLAEVSEASKRGGVLLCKAQRGPQVNPPDLWLLFAPIKKTRTDFIVEKAAEMGAARIMPVQTEFTNAERIRQDRLQAHALEAAEQCGGTFVPDVTDLTKLSALLDAWPTERKLMFCDEGIAGQAGAQEVLEAAGAGPWAVLIGPEGGFSQSERARLHAAEFAFPVSLGPRILRADTAAVAALTVWQQALGDWA